MRINGQCLTMLAATLLGAGLGAGNAAADVAVRFLEGAPKDRFQIANTGGCPVPSFILEIDLSATSGGLIFDTSPTGSGVEVWQPFDVTQGADLVAIAPEVTDGDQVLMIALAEMPPGAAVEFTIDVDDTNLRDPARQTTVTTADFAGARFTISQADQPPRSATASGSNEIVFATAACS